MTWGQLGSLNPHHYSTPVGNVVSMSKAHWGKSRSDSVAVQRPGGFRREPQPPPLLAPDDVMEDVGPDEYIVAMNLEPRQPDQAERDLMRALFEDGCYVVLLARRYIGFNAWPVEKRFEVARVLLDLDWMFMGDLKTHVYTFQNVMDTLKFSPNFWRTNMLRKLGLTYPQLEEFIFRGRLWLRHVHKWLVHARRAEFRDELLPVPTKEEAIMALSTHKVEIVRITLEPHPNADTLSVVRLYGGGYTAVVKTDEWKFSHIGAYIPPDSVVPHTEGEFSTVSSSRRVKAKKLRGVWSMGLLIHAPEGARVGDDVAEKIGVTHYEPPDPLIRRGDSAPPPPGVYQVYNLESFRKYGNTVFRPGEPVWVTEKLHGMNARWVCTEGRMHAGTHRRWVREEDRAAMPWHVLSKYPQIEDFCRSRPYTALYGEIYGWVQSLKYAAQGPGDYYVAIFDVWHHGKWEDPDFSLNLGEGAHLPWVPVIDTSMAFDFDKLLALADGASRVAGANCLREGIVVKPLNERWDERCGRVCLKIVSNQHLVKEKDD